jgi:hypothetical protein
MLSGSWQRRAEVEPVYRLIFSRMLKGGYDWQRLPRSDLVETQPGLPIARAFERVYRRRAKSPDGGRAARRSI